jgi:hypothetical protein
METGCIHGTDWYVRQLGTRLLPRISEIPLVSLANCLADSINEVAALHSGTCDLTHPGTPAATVAILRSAGPTEWLVLSDAVIALDTLYDGMQIIRDSRVEDTAVHQAQTVLTTPPSSPERSERRREMIAERRAARNTDGGYWVAAASPQAAGHAITGSMRPGRVRQAAVMSDGAARLVDFGVTDWPGAFEILSEQGPDALIMRVREAEGSDQECVTWPRSKPYDDAAVAYCRIDNIRTKW